MSIDEKLEEKWKNMNERKYKNKRNGEKYKNKN